MKKKKEKNATVQGNLVSVNLFLNEKCINLCQIKNLALLCHAAKYIKFGIRFTWKLLQPMNVKVSINSPFVLIY